jgi:hypothetical protein
MLQASHANAQAAYSVEIIVQGFPSNLTTNLYVDGGLNGTMTGGSTRTLIFPTSSITHIITVDFYVPNSAGLNGTRYLEPETSWVFSAGGSHTFAYKAQYFLDVQSSFGTTKGEGWYDSGASAQAILNVGEVEESPGTRHAFISWAGDAAGTSLTSSSILMDQPKKAIANWKTQYLLTVKSDPPDVQNLKGSGWYDAATQATFSAPSLVSADQDSRLRFDQWSGAFDGRTPSGTVLMDLPKVVEAHYIAQYQLTINYDPPNIPHTWNQSAWYDANSNVPLGPAVNNIELSSVERLSFMGWFEKGQQLSGVSINVLMDQPHELTLSYQTEYYVDVRSSYGQASGSGWYSRGSTATITVSSTAGSWPITYTLTGWRVDPPSGKLNRSGGSWTILVDQPYVIEAVWNFEVLPLIGLIGGIALLVALVIVALVISYRRGVFARGLSSFKPSKVPAPAAAVCGKCGSQVPKGATFCQKCGSPIAIAAPESSGLEDKVYDYILKHDGVISMKQASRDLGVSADQLKEATEALKRKGRLA